MSLIQDTFDALRQIFHPRFRAVFLQTLGLTVLCLAGVGIAADKLLLAFVTPSQPWLATMIGWFAGLGLAVGLAFLIAPVALLVGGLFFDHLAAVVEADIRPVDGEGRALPILTASWIAARFAAVALVVNALALGLLFVPGLNAVAFFGANAYLLGRGYFELAALRYVPLEEVRLLRRRHAPAILTAGLCMAALMSVPVLNLVTPLFATALAVRLRARLAATAGRRLPPRAQPNGIEPLREP